MFRLAAEGAMQSKTAIGAFIGRLRARLGASTAINAGANKLARLSYRMLKFGAAYVEQAQTYYEEKYKERLLLNLSKRAKEFGFQLTLFEPATVQFLRRAYCEMGRSFVLTSFGLTCRPKTDYRKRS
jgi:hypothetical protein